MAHRHESSKLGAYKDLHHVHYIYVMVVGLVFFMGLLTVGAGVYLTPFACS